MASGTGDIALGYSLNASGTYCFLTGYDITATGAQSAGLGSFHTISGNYSTALNTGSTTTLYGELSHASYFFAARGDRKHFFVTARNNTASTASTTLFLNGSSSTIDLPNNTCWTFTGKVTGATSGMGAVYSYTFSGCIYRGANAASTTMAATVTPTVIFESNAAADIAVTADTSAGALKVAVTAADSTATRWGCDLDVTVIGYP